MNRLLRLVSVFVVMAFVHPQSAAAQSADPRFQAGAHLATVVSSEFDETEVGAGARLSWHPGALLGVEAEVTVYPGDLGQGVSFSAGRFEGLFGATVGPRFGAIRPFAKLRPGFVRVREAPEPVACILIFPPPLTCQLAGGTTLFALDVGGGVEWFPSAGTWVRVDAGDRMVRYPAPAIDSSGTVRDDSFTGHDFRFTIGGGVRF